MRHLLLAVVLFAFPAVSKVVEEPDYAVIQKMGAVEVQFTAPEPIDSRIQLRTVPQNKLAAIAYSGFWSEANSSEHLEMLKSALRAANVQWTGEPVYARYNPPWTPWFMRRNEIWLAMPDQPPWCLMCPGIVGKSVNMNRAKHQTLHNIYIYKGVTT